MPPNPEHCGGPGCHVFLHGRRIRSRWRLPHLPACDAGKDAIELSITPTAVLDAQTDGFETLLATSRATTEERSVFSLGREGAGESAIDRLCWDRLVDVRIATGRIDCTVLHCADRHEVEARLLGPTTAYWLERLGHAALHASVLALDGRAVVVAGPSAAGKSVTAAAGWSAGARILADDLCGVHFDEGRPIVYPGPRWVRLDPEIARHFGLPFPHRARRRRGKIRVHLKQPADEACTLTAILLLSPRDGSRGRLHDLGGTDAFLRLQAASYVGPEVAHRAGFEAARFLTLTRLLDDVPVYDLALPEGLDEAQRAVEQILDRLTR